MQSIRRLTPLLWLALVVLPVAGIRAAGPQAGETRLLREALARRLTLRVRQAPLGEVAPRIAHEIGAPFWLDRRVDKRRLVNLQATDASILETLAPLRSEAGLATATVGPVLYFGPAETADRIVELARERARALPRGEARRRLLRAAPFGWPRLATPREGIDAAARAASLGVANPEDVPHDLWPAARYPATPIADQLTLLLAGFDKSWRLEPDQRAIRVVDLPRGDPAESE